ncbi:MAG: DUF4040 domain-containing protein [Fimbriimonadales bacterium]
MWIDLTLLGLLLVLTLGIVFSRDTLSGSLLLGAYSLILAMLWVSLNAADVALTEAAIGAGVATPLLLLAISRSTRTELAETLQTVQRYRWFPPFLMLILVGAALVYASLDMPPLGDPKNPANQHVAPYYTQNAYTETGSENIVTAILVCYRGFDTFGEVLVVMTAGVAMMLILRRS